MTDQLYHNFDLELHKVITPADAAVSYEVKLAYSEPGGDYAPEIITGLPNSAEIAAFFDQIRYYRMRMATEALFRNEGEEVDELPLDFARKLGQELFKLIFTGKIVTAYRLAQDRARQAKPGRGLRIRLKLDLAAPELQNQPWEYIYDPDEKKDFLTTDRLLPLVRYLGQEQPLSFNKAPPAKLRVLVIFGADLPGKNRQEAWKAEVEKLGTIFKEAGQPVEIVTPGVLTFGKLNRWLQDTMQQFQVVHYIGHGEVDKERQEGYLLFPDENGRKRIYSSDFQTLLNGQTELRLIMLNACFGSCSGGNEAFSSVVARLTLTNALTVIGMQLDILDQTAMQFARDLYYYLAQGNSVDMALAKARSELYLTHSKAEFGVPVLYCRAPQPVQLLKVSRNKGGTEPIYRATSTAEGLAALIEETERLIGRFEKYLLQEETSAGQEFRGQSRIIFEELKKRLQQLSEHKARHFPDQVAANSTPATAAASSRSKPESYHRKPVRNASPPNLLNVPRLIEQGRQFYYKGEDQLEQARQYFTWALDKAPNSPIAQMWLGKTLLDLGRDAEGLAHLKKAIELQPEYIEAYIELSTAYYLLGMPKEQLEWLDKALSQEAANAQALKARGLFYYDRDMVVEAAADLERALEYGEDEADLHLYLGDCFYEMENPQKKRAFEEYSAYQKLNLEKNSVSEALIKVRKRLQILSSEGYRQRSA